MKKKLVASMLLFVFVLCSSVAFSKKQSYLSDLVSEANAVKSYFDGSGSLSSAAAAFDELYDYLFADAKDYVLNTKSCKFHKPNCKGVQTMSEKNRLDVTCSRTLLIDLGFDDCDMCKP